LQEPRLSSRAPWFVLDLMWLETNMPSLELCDA
jgi:hypothetical protein